MNLKDEEKAGEVLLHLRQAGLDGRYLGALSQPA